MDRQIDPKFVETSLRCNLPGDVVLGIILRLPIKSLLRFRSVCKPWHAFLRSSSFIKLHLHNSNHNKLIGKEGKSHSEEASSRFYLYGLDCYVPVSLSLPFSLHPKDVWKVEGSCNGLLCISVNQTIVVLWNPATRKYRFMEVPVLEVATEEEFLPYVHCRCSSPFTGFGFVPDTDDYKILRIGFDEIDSNIIAARILLYSLKCDSWRPIEFGIPDITFQLGLATPLGRFLHWFASDELELIVSFDLAKEVFRPISLPDSHVFHDYKFTKYIMPLKGLLSVFIRPKFEQEDSYFDIWMMTEYGAPESWSKQFSIKLFQGVLRPVTSWTNCDIIFKYNYLNTYQFFLYETNTKEIRCFPGYAFSSAVFCYVESLESVDPILPSCTLPEDVMVDIMSRLPVRYLIRFRCVSKKWRALLTHPSFIRKHIHKSNHNKLISSTWDLKSCRVVVIYSLDYENPLNVPIPFPMDYGNFMCIEGSSNGLVCVSLSSLDKNDPKVVLWNPATRKYRLLNVPLLLIEASEEFQPQVENRFGFKPPNFTGFGFISDTLDYKIVRITFNEVNPNRMAVPILVYSLRMDSWRVVKFGISGITFCSPEKNSTLLDGFLHWLAYTSDGLDIIVSFNLANDVFHSLALPDSQVLHTHETKKNIIALKGFLSVFVPSKLKQGGTCFDVWVMTEYGAPDSWNKQLRIELFPAILNPEPVASWRNGEVIFDFEYMESSHLILYDTNIQQHHVFPEYSSVNTVFSYIESLESVEGGMRENEPGI